MAPSFPNRDNKKRASSGSPPTPPRHGRSTRPGTDGDRSRRHVNPGGAEQSHSAPNPRDAPNASTTSSTAEARDWRPVQRQPWEYDRVSHTICHRHGCIPCSQYRDHVQDTEELGVASYRAAQQAMQRDLAETARLSGYAAGHRDALHDRASESRPAPSVTIASLRERIRELEAMNDKLRGSMDTLRLVRGHDILEDDGFDSDPDPYLEDPADMPDPETLRKRVREARQRRWRERSPDRADARRQHALLHGSEAGSSNPAPSTTSATTGPESPAPTRRTVDGDVEMEDDERERRREGKKHAAPPRERSREPTRPRDRSREHARPCEHHERRPRSYSRSRSRSRARQWRSPSPRRQEPPTTGMSSGGGGARGDWLPPYAPNAFDAPPPLIRAYGGHLPYDHWGAGFHPAPARGYQDHHRGQRGGYDPYADSYDAAMAAFLQDQEDAAADPARAGPSSSSRASAPRGLADSAHAPTPHPSRVGIAPPRYDPYPRPGHYQSRRPPASEFPDAPLPDSIPEDIDHLSKIMKMSEFDGRGYGAARRLRQWFVDANAKKTSDRTAAEKYLHANWKMPAWFKDELGQRPKTTKKVPPTVDAPVEHWVQWLNSVNNRIVGIRRMANGNVDVITVRGHVLATQFLGDGLRQRRQEVLPDLAELVRNPRAIHDLMEGANVAPSQTTGPYEGELPLTADSVREYFATRGMTTDYLRSTLMPWAQEWQRVRPRAANQAATGTHGGAPAPSTPAVAVASLGDGPGTNEPEDATTSGSAPEPSPASSTITPAAAPETGQREDALMAEATQDTPAPPAP